MTNPNTTKTTTDNSQNNDYINHYMSGKTVIYVYSFKEYTDPATGKTLQFFNGNIKTGKKDGDNYAPVQGTLSPLAYDNLKALIPMVKAGTHTVGVTVKTPRFEGSTAFLANAVQGEKDAIILADGSIKKLVSAIRLRLNNVDQYKLFERKQVNQAQPQGQAPQAPQPAPVDPKAQSNNGWPQPEVTPVPG